MNGEMTSQERILAAARRQSYDRVPVCPKLLAFNVAHVGPEPIARLIDETDPCWLAAIGTEMEYYIGKQGRERVTEYREDGLIHTVLETPKGDLHRSVRFDPARGTGWAVEDFFKDIGDIDKFLSIPYEPADPDLSDYLSHSALLGENGIVQVSIPSAINLPAGWFEPMSFNIYSVEERDRILHLIETVNERIVRFMSRAAEMGVEYFWMYGPEYAGPPLMHPRCYEIFARPFDQEIVDAVHAHGAILHTHMHGKVWEVLEPLIGTGMDVISPIEAPPMGNVDVRHALERFGSRVCFAGNLDDYEVIGKGDLELVRRRAEEAVRAWNDSGGHFILGGTDDTANTLEIVEGFLEMGRVSREFSIPR